MEDKFIIWDNRTAQYVSYGFIQVVDENRFAVSMEDWESLMSGVAETILDNIPFVKGVL